MSSSSSSKETSSLASSSSSPTSGPMVTPVGPSVLPALDDADFLAAPSNFEHFWPLFQFFLLTFCKKIIDLPGGQINDPRVGGKYCFLLLLPATPRPSLGPLKGFLSPYSARALKIDL